MYNLAVMTEEGHNIPANVLEQMKISTQPPLNTSDVVEKLLLRCGVYTQHLKALIIIFRVVLAVSECIYG